MKKPIFLLLFASICNFALGQIGSIDYHHLKNQKLIPSRWDLDKENILTYSNKIARLYFRQSDVKKIIEAENYLSQKSAVLKLLSLQSEKINLIDLDSYTKNELDSIKQIQQFYNSSGDEIIDLIHDVFFKLILDGKFMIFDLKEKRFIDQGLKGKIKSKGWYVCYLPSKKFFFIGSTGIIVE